MQVHNSLKELLEDLLEDLEINGYLMKEMPIPDVVNLYLSSNSLDLERQLLEKKKQTENKCVVCGIKPIKEPFDCCCSEFCYDDL